MTVLINVAFAMVSVASFALILVLLAVPALANQRAIDRSKAGAR